MAGCISAEYGAGFLDGEGTFTAWLVRGNSLNTCVSASNRNREVIHQMREMFGGSVRKYDRGRVGQAPYYLWSCTGKTAERVLRFVRPHLIVKKEVCDAVLALRNMVLSPAQVSARRQSKSRGNDALHSGELELRKRLIGYVKHLNARGVPR